MHKNSPKINAWNPSPKSKTSEIFLALFLPPSHTSISFQSPGLFYFLYTRSPGICPLVLSQLHCIALYCFVLHCIVLYCIVLYCIVLYCIVLYCIVLYCIVLYCIVLYCYRFVVSSSE